MLVCNTLKKHNKIRTNILKFSISEARVDVVQAESTRFRQRVEVLEKQLDEANVALQEERQRTQVSPQSEMAEIDVSKISRLSTDIEFLISASKDFQSLYSLTLQAFVKQMKNWHGQIKVPESYYTAKRCLPYPLSCFHWAMV